MNASDPALPVADQIVVHSFCQARQYRVQTREQNTDWQRHATFPDERTAHQCLEALAAEGRDARLVALAIAPVAA